MSQEIEMPRRGPDMADGALQSNCDSRFCGFGAFVMTAIPRLILVLQAAGARGPWYTWRRRRSLD